MEAMGKSSPQKRIIAAPPSVTVWGGRAALCETEPLGCADERRDDEEGGHEADGDAEGADHAELTEALKMGEDKHGERDDGGEPGRDEGSPRFPDRVKNGLFPAVSLVELLERATVDMDGEVDAHANEHGEDEGGEDVQAAVGDRDDAEGPGLPDEERRHDDGDGAEIAEEEHEQGQYEHDGEGRCGGCIVRDLLDLSVAAVGAHDEGAHLRMERLGVELGDGLLAPLEDLLGVGGVGAAALHAGGEDSHLAAACDHVVAVLFGQVAKR
jgi:hypothetical protein